MDLASLISIRLREMETVLPLFPPRSRVLEIGAGSGHQALQLAQHGFDVTALEVADSQHAPNRVFPIELYDGVHVPYPDRTFDVVYTSNVLEHVADPADLLLETVRVLSLDGRGVHVVPTSTWRLWSLLAFYPDLIRRVLGGGRSNSVGDETEPRKRRPLSAYGRALVPHRHGDAGTALGELATYTRWRWRSLFRSLGFEVEVERPTRLFYTGTYLLGTRLPVSLREGLARVFGSACRVFVVKPTEALRPGGQ